MQNFGVSLTCWYDKHPKNGKTNNMKITGTLTCDFNSLQIKYDEKKNTRMAMVGLRCRVDKPGAKKMFGSDFAAVAFDLLRVSDGVYTLGYKSLKPALTCEIHSVSLCGHTVTGTLPMVKEIVPVDDEVAVVADIRISVSISDSLIAGALAAAVGDMIEVRFEPSQGELSL